MASYFHTLLHYHMHIFIDIPHFRHVVCFFLQTTYLSLFSILLFVLFLTSPVLAAAPDIIIIILHVYNQTLFRNLSYLSYPLSPTCSLLYSWIQF